MVLNNIILRYTNYKNNIFSHGGDKRSSQILEILKSGNFNVIDFGFDKTEIDLKFKIKCFLTGIKVKILFYNYLTCNVKEIANVGWLYLITKKILKENKHNTNVLIWEDTKGISFIVPYLAKKMNFYVIGLPHNLESLVHNPELLIDRKKIKNLENEIKLLRSIDSVYTISIEENWLLSLFNVNTYYLPYYPPIEYVNSICGVNVERERSVKKYYLILSTFWGATMDGVLDLVNMINNSDLEEEFIIAGFGTDRICQLVDLKSNIKLCGEVSSEKLKMLMCDAKALIINQNASSGALTRIKEFLIVNVPIIANVTSARSYYNIEGITLYSDFDSLISIINNNAFEKYIKNTKDKNWENDFLRNINKRYK